MICAIVGDPQGTQHCLQKVVDPGLSQAKKQSGALQGPQVGGGFYSLQGEEYHQPTQ